MMKLRAVAFLSLIVSPLAAQAADIQHGLGDLSPWGMFMAADVVVKSVMVGLTMASVLTWTILIAKTIELRLARRDVARSIADLPRMPSLAAAHDQLARQRVGRAFVEAAVEELRASELAMDKTGVKERVRSRLSRLELAAGRQLGGGTGLLATIGSTAPFVGLFGTVWGIMNSFIGITKAQTTNLAVVAPGIAEALLATAIGLVAAIPAVVIYNQFARSISSYRALVGDVSEEVMRMTSRDLDRMTTRAARPQEAVHGR
ncbi:MAG: tonB-system energizer ExbB [Hyphomicrobiales bacterium]|nr:tonB-system energizer ExbB [Hyphomicrobiales bacterium]